MICVYEDSGLDQLSPLVDLRPAFDLRCGRFTILEKLRRLYPREEFHLWVREELAGITAEAHPDCAVNAATEASCLFVSGRVILDEPLPVTRGPEILLAGDEVVAFRTGRAIAGVPQKALDLDLPARHVAARVLRYPWDVVEFCTDELLKECRVRAKGSGHNHVPAQRAHKGITVVGRPGLLTLSPGSRVWPGAVISTETGPVFLDRGAVIRPGSFVEGPCYIGSGTIIDGARVRPGCSFGPHCRIGGEVEASVFQGYANKHHDGFIGHSFVGEWANLGALTTNSDLKNAYQPVSVFFDGKPVDSGLLKVGCFIGDHVKTAIGSLFNTGARVGTFANWFEPGLSPKEIPAFAWGARSRWTAADAVANARAVMARRGVKLTPAYEAALGALHRRTR